MKREGRTVIYVTHDLATVERFCDRALLLERGEVVAVGDPRQVVNAYRRANLDQEQTEHAREATERGRWGDGAAEIVDAWFEDEEGTRQEILVQSKSVTFRAVIRFHRPMEHPVFGFILRNERSDDVFVTNTMFDTSRRGCSGRATRSSTPSPSMPMSPTPLHGHAGGRAPGRPALRGLARRRVQRPRARERYTSGIVDLPHETSVVEERAAARIDPADSII